MQYWNGFTVVLGNLVSTYNIKYTYIDMYDPW